jgi:hypothetical protein
MAKRGRPPKDDVEADVEAAVIELIRRGIVDDRKQKRANLKAEEIAQETRRELIEKANSDPGWSSLKRIASARTIAYRQKRFKKNAAIRRKRFKNKKKTEA